MHESLTAFDAQLAYMICKCNVLWAPLRRGKAKANMAVLSERNDYNIGADTLKVVHLRA